MADPKLSPEDEAAIRQILTNWRDEDGTENPLLPMEVDVDGDGIVDSWGLDDQGEVIFVPGCPLAETVFHADGDGLDEGV